MRGAAARQVISDLLKPERTNLVIREDRKRGVFVDGLSEWVVRSPQEVRTPGGPAVLGPVVGARETGGNYCTIPFQGRRAPCQCFASFQGFRDPGMSPGRPSLPASPGAGPVLPQQRGCAPPPTRPPFPDGAPFVTFGTGGGRCTV